MTIKVVHGLIRERHLAEKSATRADLHQQPPAAAARSAQLTGSVAGNEATLTTLRSSRSAVSAEKIRDADHAKREANQVAEKIHSDQEAAEASHDAGLSPAARNHLTC